MAFLYRSKLFSTTLITAQRTTSCLQPFTIKSNSIHTSASVHQRIWNVYHKCKRPSLYHHCLRKVYFPEEYTVRPLKNDHLGGRDPETGRVITARIGGGVKHLFHWVDAFRKGPTVANEFYEEKVILIKKCGCRSAFVALVAGENKMRYILATINMKPGDIIRTSQFIPKNSIEGKEGDAYPLGALQVGTLINCIEKRPGEGAKFIKSAGSSAVIIKKINKRVIVKMPSKLEISFDENCMATVGVLSNAEHKDFVLGTPQKHRELGRRPKSGLFQKKTGRFGRKIKPPPKLKVIPANEEEESEYVRVTFDHIPIKYPSYYI